MVTSAHFHSGPNFISVEFCCERPKTGTFEIVFSDLLLSLLFDMVTSWCFVVLMELVYCTFDINLLAIANLKLFNYLWKQESAKAEEICRWATRHFSRVFMKILYYTFSHVYWQQFQYIGDSIIEYAQFESFLFCFVWISENFCDQNIKINIVPLPPVEKSAFPRLELLRSQFESGLV